MASIIFAAVLSNIIEYMRQRKRRLTTMLLSFGFNLTEYDTQPTNYERRPRYHSVDSFLSSVKERQESRIQKGLTHAQIENLIEFLNCLCDCYEEVTEVTSSGIELACQDILAQCQIGNDLHGYDIHKSIFHEQVLKYPQIKVNTLIM